MRSYNLEKDFLNKSNCGSGIIYNKETEQFDVTLDIKTEHLIKVTWQELVDLKNQSALEPGVFYRITDYEFTSTDPEVISAEHRFDIIVLALSEDTLSEDARAIQHDFTEEEKQIYSEEEQHYFDNSELSAWKLKYSLDGNSKRFAWAPFNLNPVIKVWNGWEFRLYYRDPESDKDGFYGWNNSYSIIYTTTEVPNEKDGFYGYDSDQDKFYSDSKYAYYGYKSYLVNCGGSWYHQDSQGWSTQISSISDLLQSGDTISLFGVSDSYIVIEPVENIEYNGSIYPGYVICCSTISYYLPNGNQNTVSSRFNYTWSSNYKYQYASQSNDNVSIRSEEDLVIGQYYELYYNGDYSDANYVYEDPKPEVLFIGFDNYVQSYSDTTIYKGVIYGMIDEFENDCEYDFKNALIAGKYSLFDPDQFYYTFTNQGSTPSLLKSKDKPILLYPGTYSFLGCMPFRLYEESGGYIYIKPDVSNTEYSGWDLYAAICDTEGYIDEDTGERHYKLEMYVFNEKIFRAIKVLEDREWYTLSPVPEQYSPDFKIYSKTLYTETPIITEYSWGKDSSGSSKWYWKNTNVYGQKDDSIKYMPQYRAWIYTGSNWGHDICDTYCINLNYKGYYTGTSFDISTNSDTYASDLIMGNSSIYFVTDNNGRYGIRQDYYNHQFDLDVDQIDWIQQNLPITSNVTSDSYSQVISNSTYKFTKPITITEPMYIYLSPCNTTAKYADSCVIGDIMLSPKKIIESGDTGYDLYCTNRDYSELNGDLYAWSFTVVNPNDTSCAYSYYGPDCYRVTLRNSWFGGTFKVIPKVIMDDVQSSTIEAQQVFLQDCYCVKARNGGNGGYPYSDTFGNYWSSDNKLFLRNVHFAELQDVDYTTIEDCYCINITRVKNSHIRNFCQALKANDCQDIILDAVAESTVEHCNGIQVYGVWGSHLFKCFQYYGSSANTIKCLCDSILYNVQNCNINADREASWSGTYGYSKIYINGLQNKDIDLSDYLSDQDTSCYSSRCVHIRSEDDLTITV